MSSVDSYLNSAATILSHDLYKRFVNPQADERRLLIIGRTTTCGLLAWAIGFAFLLLRASEESGIYAIFQTMMAFFQGPALAVLLLGVFWRRATGKAAVTAFLCGIACTTTLFTLSQPRVTQWLGAEPLFQIPDPFLYFSVWAFLVTALVLVLVSLVTRAEPEAKTQYMLFCRRTAE